MGQPGQGKPLPDFLKCDGAWIIENHLYLYFDSQEDSSSRFTVGAQRNDGQPCFGLSVAQIAAALGVDHNRVISANRDQSLLFLGVADTVPTRGGISARTFAFQLRERRGSLTIETYEQEGTA